VKPITYGQFWSLLQTLGLEEKRIPRSHVLFTHAPTDTRLMFPTVRRNARVRPGHLTATRFMLDARGLVSRERWDELVWKIQLR
jgi:hypothetical protein